MGLRVQSEIDILICLMHFFKIDSSRKFENIFRIPGFLKVQTMVQTTNITNMSEHCTSRNYPHKKILVSSFPIFIGYFFLFVTNLLCRLPSRQKSRQWNLDPILRSRRTDTYTYWGCTGHVKISRTGYRITGAILPYAIRWKFAESEPDRPVTGCPVQPK